VERQGTRKRNGIQTPFPSLELGYDPEVRSKNLLVVGPEQADRVVVLAHGAGAAMDSPFMNEFAGGLASKGIRVVRFEFPYMRKRRREGRGGAPDRQPVLERSWKEVIGSLGDPARLVIGGKSLGGRIASVIADDSGVAGLVCLGYPFHPPRRPERLRTAHLAGLGTPALIVQGTRDPFGVPEEIASYALSPLIRLHYLEDGDHSFKPRKKSGRTLEQNLEEAIDAVAAFVSALAARRADGA
jgi:predicted alpha/beta-hydrolase family hydrolase